MDRQVKAGLGIVISMVMALMVLAQMDTLQDTGEAATTDTLTSLLQTIAPISLILLGGGLIVVLLIGAVSLFGRITN